MSSSDSDDDWESCVIKRVKKLSSFTDPLRRKKPEKPNQEFLSFPEVDFCKLKNAVTQNSASTTAESNITEKEKPTANNSDRKRKAEFRFGSIKNFLIPSADAPNPTPWKNDPARPPPDLKHDINSVIVTAKLGVVIPLETIAKNGINLSFNPDQSKCIFMRLKEHPTVRIMVFQSGQLIVSGGKNTKDAKDAAKITCRKLIKWGATNAKLFKLRVNNIAANVHLDFKVQLSSLLNDSFREHKYVKPTQLDPHAFNGVHMTVALANTQCTVVVFATGAVLITGLKEEANISRVIDRIYPLLKMYAV